MVEQATATSTIFSESFQQPQIINHSEKSSPIIGARDFESPINEKSFTQIAHHSGLPGESRNLLINHFFGQTLHKQSPFHVKAKKMISRSPIGNYTQQIKVPDTQSSPFNEINLTPDGSRIMRQSKMVLISKNRTRNNQPQGGLKSKTALNMDICDLTLPDEHIFTKQNLCKPTYRINPAKITYGIMLKNRAEYNSYIQKKDSKRRPRQVLHFGGGPNRVKPVGVQAQWQEEEANYISNNTFTSIKTRDFVQNFHASQSRSVSPQNQPKQSIGGADSK
ncbi:hypothetical protein FGO68_gene6510 [Halteria grandinella]|uniref:Uncharacterized protein n=1 Tax=Halteria grandinella TaxID=5974 RepID=A0A8J8T9N5_HALGN|nr:hypothetical protein FGO68_gene6510 [Halteria grandinella]